MVKMHWKQVTDPQEIETLVLDDCDYYSLLHNEEGERKVAHWPGVGDVDIDIRIHRHKRVIVVSVCTLPIDLEFPKKNRRWYYKIHFNDLVFALLNNLSP